ncbi:hypothetical protein FNT36_10200 [Hymenobacter setariae]|uniref:DUF6438 domain-containing protein n=1 Tax=Hymenobacter setariae TaxID=2594794 RepID=A0A558BZ44_9BACT|nr:DUF6438 domain-containing protein [Hymenobacter setariae]TVT41784.1 hypothetical protein FNT36_10200 [Hymenobacter setariae]
MKHFIWLLMLSLSLPACAQRKLPRRSKASTSLAKPAQATEPVLVFQRTPCYGTCPAYKATIFADGRVEYDGQRFVTLLGKHTLRLPVATVQGMLAEAKRIDFNSLQARYSHNTSDLPSTIITVHPVGQSAKVVSAEEDYPEKLQGYINYLKAKLDPLADTKPTE